MHPLATAAFALMALQTTPPPARPSSAGFSAHQVIVADPQAFLEEWGRPGPHVDIHLTRAVGVGQPVTVFVLFQSCRVASDGACHVKATLQVIGPNGRPTPLRSTFVVASKPPVGVGLIARSEQGPTIKLDGDAKPGLYTLQTVVTDEGDPLSPIVLHRESSLMLNPR